MTPRDICALTPAQAEAYLADEKELRKSVVLSPEEIKRRLDARRKAKGESI
jgi:hypothetical protein